MKIEIITNWRIWVVAIVSVCGFLFSLINFFLGKYITARIIGNDLKHLEKDVTELKTNEKEYRVDLKKELHNISLAVRRIEKKQTVRDSICEERHKNIKKN